MIFANSLPFAKAFFATLPLPVSTTLHLMRFLAACFHDLRSASDAASAIRIDSRHRAQMIRFLARQRWSQNWNTLNALVDLLLQRCYCEQGTWVFALDQTYHTTTGERVQNTFSRANTKKRPKNSNRKQKKTPRHRCHCFVFGLLISPQTGTRLPSVRSYYTKEYCQTQAQRKNRSGTLPVYRTQTDIAAEMIRKVQVPVGTPVLVLGDTAFEAKQIRSACLARRFDWITPANSQRVLAGNKNRQSLSEYRTHVCSELAHPISVSPGLTPWFRHQRGSSSKAWRGKYARQYWAHSETLDIHNVGTVAVVFSTTQQPQPGKPSEVQKILLSNREDWDAERIVHAYSVRWQIEQFFKEMKSDLGMSRYRMRDFQEVEGWIQVCCIAFVYLEWYRLHHQEQSEHKEWWWRLRTRGLILQVRQQIETGELEHIAKAMETEAGRTQLRDDLRRAMPLELRQPA